MKKSNQIWIRAVAGIIALIIPAILFSIKSPPFSLLEAQAQTVQAAEAEPSAPAAAEASAEAAPSAVTRGEQLLVIVPESFDQVIAKDPEKRAALGGGDTWTKTLTLVNPGDKSVTAYLFVQDLATCSEQTTENCVAFPASVTLVKDGHELVTLTFTKIALKGNQPTEGKLLLAGGDVQAEIPFSITGAWQHPLSAFADAGRWVLVGLLGLLVAYVIYLLLYSKVIPFLLCERFVPLTMEVDDENKTLWSLFSSRLSEMGEQGYGSLTSPRAKPGSIELPETNLGKEGDIFKTIISLLSWILPRRGRSIRLKSIETHAQGKGVSAALVCNNDDQVLADHIFWANDYCLGGQTCDIEYLLMTPVILWLSDFLQKEKPRGRKKEKDQSPWDAQAYCELARLLWSKNPELGKRLYTIALSIDATNRQAQANLGRIWYELSQQDDNESHETEDCVNFAASLLKEASRDDALEPRDVPTWFASQYNLAVVYLEQGISEKNKKVAKEKKELAFNLCNGLLVQIKIIYQLSKERSTRKTRRAKGRNKDKYFLDWESVSKDKDFIDWLHRFEPMVQIFQRSVLLENHPPQDETALRQAIKQTLQIMNPKVENANWLLVNLNYRAQYNAACYFCRCYELSKKFLNKKERLIYGHTALDYLRLALGYGGGLAVYARKDRTLKTIQEDTRFKKEFDDIAPQPKPEPQEEESNDMVLHLVVDKPIVVKS